jgi:DNA invertase Pin-like site-specific DNA recombinase
MAGRRWVAYYRVSTERQGRSGLGLDAQREAVRAYLAGKGWPPAQEFTEVESGKRADRPELAKALAACRLHGATLVVAKLDRLARNTRFLLSVVEGTGEEGVVFCDLPAITPGAVGKFMVTQMAAVAELEAAMISARTKAALAAAKARGVALGGRREGAGDLSREAVKGRAVSAALRTSRARQRAADLSGTIADLRASGAMSLRDLAAGLNARNIPTARGGTWSAVQVSRVLSQMPHSSARSHD